MFQTIKVSYVSEIRHFPNPTHNIAPFWLSLENKIRIDGIELIPEFIYTSAI